MCPGAAAVTSQAKPQRSHACVANPSRVDRARPWPDQGKPIRERGGPSPGAWRFDRRGVEPDDCRRLAHAVSRVPRSDVPTIAVDRCRGGGEAYGEAAPRCLGRLVYPLRSGRLYWLTPAKKRVNSPRMSSPRSPPDRAARRVRDGSPPGGKTRDAGLQRSRQPGPAGATPKSFRTTNAHATASRGLFPARRPTLFLILPAAQAFAPATRAVDLLNPSGTPRCKGL